LVTAAVDGIYTDPYFGELDSDAGDSKRLRAVVQNLNLDFAELMRTHGQRHVIVDQKEPGSSSRITTRAQFEDRIVNLLKRNRGRELPGMYNPMIVGELFHQQAQPWEGKATVHVRNICSAVEVFFGKTLTYLADDNTSSNLLRDVTGPLMSERVKDINAKVNEILIPFTRGHPITYNHYFTETIQSIRQKRLEKDITDRLRKFSPEYFEGSGKIMDNFGANLKVSDLVSALSTRNEVDMDKYAASEILLCMEAYYKVSAVSFL